MTKGEDQMSTLKEQLEKYRDEKDLDEMNHQYQFGYEQGFTECLELLYPLVEALEKVKNNQKHWNDIGHICDSKKLLQSNSDLARQALQELRENLK